ncbi:MAG: arsenate reductase (glutaredoxin), partial [Hyphomicrobiaceae bacterium]
TLREGLMVRLYHNPRCSKSRAALALLEERGVEIDIVTYLDGDLSEDALRDLLKKLGLGPRDVMRSGEAVFKELGLGEPSLGDDALTKAIVANPILLERPIVVNGRRAAIGRPTEAILDIL